ncbi:MAG: 2-oxo acid dehydrogenase subunit E2 [Myxococcales bacterium]|nr:2-oxo acid dehydrogenase subunit E2 [Myxococcales bacterium]
MKGFTVEPNSSWRTVAMATWGSQAEASIYGWLDIDVSRLLPRLAEAPAGTKITLTHAVGKAVALALAESPSANAVVSRGRVLRRESVDVFFSVATNGGKGLAGQKLRGVDAMPLADIARDMQKGVSRIRERGDTPMQKSQKLLGFVPKPLLSPLLHGIAALSFDWGLDLNRVGVPTDPFGSAIVTNVGTLGIEQGFGPLMEHGRTAVLITVGMVRDKVVAVDGRPEVRPVLTLGATFDHRVVDGFTLGRLSATIRRTLETARLD